MRDRARGFARVAIEHSIPRLDRLDAFARLAGGTPRDQVRTPGDGRRDGAGAIVCARELVADLRGIVGRLPGATGISFQPFEAWASLYITVSTDAAVDALGGALGLGASERGAADGQWWCRAASPHDVGITIIGPLHKGTPAHDDSGESSP